MTDIANSVAPDAANLTVKRKRIPPLNNMDGIHRNMRQVFREARYGTIDVADASKLVYMLKIMSETSAALDMESRLNELEQSQIKDIDVRSQSRIRRFGVVGSSE